MRADSVPGRNMGEDFYRMPNELRYIPQMHLLLGEDQKSRCLSLWLS